MLDRRAFNMFNPQMALLQTCNGLRAAKLQYDSGIIEQEAQEIRSNSSLCERLASREAESAGLLACRVHGTTSPILHMSCEGEFELYEDPWADDLAWHQCPEFHKALNGVRFIAGHIKRENDSIRVRHLQGVIDLLGEGAVSGEGGLEICGHGVGSAFPVDIHARCGSGDGWDHPASAHPV